MFGQEKVNISAGIGFIELINIGVRYQVTQSEIGASIGWWPPYNGDMVGWGNMISLSGNYYYHFMGSNKYSDLRPWYGKVGLNCVWESGDEIDLLPIYLRIGRDIYFDQNSGISIDAGLGYDLDSEIGGTDPLLPVFGISLLYRF
jgi:hypothetical protein